MKRVDQRIICGLRGDCMTAAVASILGLPYKAVPTWVADAVDRKKPHEQHNDMIEWLREWGYHLLTINWKNLHDFRPLVGVLCIASMPSQRFEGGRHAVIGSWKKMKEGWHKFYVVHDPNWKNKLYHHKAVPLDVHFLVPIQPGTTPPAPCPPLKSGVPWPPHRRHRGKVRG